MQGREVTFDNIVLEGVLRAVELDDDVVGGGDGDDDADDDNDDIDETRPDGTAVE